MTQAQPKRRSQTVFALRELWRAFIGTLGGLVGMFRPIWQALERGVGPVLATVSSLGWFVLTGALVSLAISRLLGWVEFTYLGVTLLAGFLVAIVFAIGRSTYAVEIELNPRRVVAGSRAMGRMMVTNSGSRTLLPTRMELPVGAGTAEFIVPRLAAGASNEELFAVPTAKRALILAGPAISVRGDQLGFIRRVMRWTDQIELFVHPQTTRLIATARGLVRDLEGQTTKVITNSDLAFHALRTYEPGDDIRNVHWRTSARTGQLMVRQYQETRRSQLLLVQSTQSKYYANDDEFELGVSVMASIGVQVIKEETELNILWEKGSLRSRSMTALLDDSCRLEPVTSAFSNLREFVRVASAKLPAPSLAVIVVGSQATTSDVRSVSTLFGSDTQLIAIRVEAGADSKLNKIGNIMMATVGQLNELPMLLERSGR